MKLLVLDGNSIANRAFYGIKLLTTKDGKRFFMAFTDWMELKKWKDEENQQTFALKFEDYAAMLLRKDAQGNTSPALGFVINPYGGNIVISKEMAAGLMAARLAKAKGKNCYSVSYFNVVFAVRLDNVMLVSLICPSPMPVRTSFDGSHVIPGAG